MAKSLILFGDNISVSENDEKSNNKINKDIEDVNSISDQLWQNTHINRHTYNISGTHITFNTEQYTEIVTQDSTFPRMKSVTKE